MSDSKQQERITDPERVELVREARIIAEDEVAPVEVRLFAERVLPFLEIEGEPADD